MRWAVKHIVLCSICFCCHALHAQTDEAEEIRLRIEKYIENSESTMDYTDLYDQIDRLLKHPVNLNNANAESLSAIPLITPLMIQTILAHRKQYGAFQSIYELQQLEGFDPEFIRLILPFVTVEEVYSIQSFKSKAFWLGGQHELITNSSSRIEKGKGYTLPSSDPNAYKGSALHQVLRYNGAINDHLQINVVAEKDAGERADLKTSFLSGGMVLRNMGKMKTLCIGDYQAAFGQGLTFGSGLAFGKSPFVMNIMRTQNDLRAYHSLNENEFLRGLGASIALHKRLQLTCFYSGKKIDGTAQTDSNQVTDGFSSLINTGYYRSANELAKKEALRRRIVGSHLTYQSDAMTLGVTAVRTFFDQRIIQGDAPYQLYNFTGTSIVNLGTDYKFYYRNLIVFGEISANAQAKNVSSVNGLLVSLGKNLDVSLQHRHYDQQYTASISNAIGEFSDNRNENGLYAGFSLIPFKGYKLNGYADLYHAPWYRYLIDAPSAGKDRMLELQYAKRKSYNWYIRCRSEVKQMNEEGTQHQNRMENNTRTQFRFHIEHFVSPQLSIRSRIEMVKYQLQFGKTTTGFMMFQDVNVALSKHLKVVGRLMYFDVQDYDARIYAFENDMLYAYSVPAFQNRGTRFYVLFKYKLKRNIDIWTRFASTSYENIHTIGSGYDLIAGSKATDIKIQLKWTL